VLQPRIIGSLTAPLNSLTHPDHRACAVNQQCAQIQIASFADVSQTLLATRGVLSWHKAKIGCEMTSADRSLCLGANMATSAVAVGKPIRYFGKALAGFVVPVPLTDLCLHHTDLALDLPDLLQHVH
jgi:hypothetical protein